MELSREFYIYQIVFYICVSNTHDHLRNHGFLLTDQGWMLSPAYDMNPEATGGGLALNISKNDNAQSLDLARSVAPVFRVDDTRMEEIIAEVVGAVRTWSDLAKQLKLPSREISLMKNAFRVGE